MWGGVIGNTTDFESVIEGSSPSPAVKDGMEANINPMDHLILYGYRGSKAHNLMLPPDEEMGTDDIDLMGVCIPPIDCYFGLKKFEQKEWWEGDEDIVVYEFRKFIRLLVKANPNVLSFLWNKDEMFLDYTEFGAWLINSRDLFSSQQAYKSFGGYASSQLHKMEHQSYQGYMGTKRKQLVKKFGYDIKNASHLIRLLKMGVEFLKVGEMTVWREEDREELLSIKRGEWTKNQVIRKSNVLFKELNEAKEKTPLPKHPDLEKINNFTRNTLEEHFADY